MSSATKQTMQVRLRPGRMGQALLVIVLVLASLMWRSQVYAAAHVTDTFYGDGAGYSTTSEGAGDSAFGYRALFLNTTGDDNTATGYHALYNNRTGSNNTASGSYALETNTGSDNTASGYGALQFNTIGYNNTASGSEALLSNGAGYDNTASGFETLLSNDSGVVNTATGALALRSNITGGYNTATGVSALYSNTSGNNNTANGVNAMFYNTTGKENTATGFQALQANNGNDNTASGFDALYSNTTGTNNIALGNQAGFNLTTGSNNIDIGNSGVTGESAKIRIGTKGTQTATFIAGISGKTVASGVGVIINANGQLGTVQSSARFKDRIKPMDKASEALLALEPVTFRYKHDLDPDSIPQFGLIAEQVEKVDPNLVVRDEDGRVTTVRYEAVNAMLLNEFLKEHITVRELKTTVAKQQKEFQATVAQQQKQIEALTSGLQKVNEQVALQKAAPQIAANQQ